ncbi:RNA methyltransferase [Oscillatoria salina]|uniref:RNA methyltransferase n=1 Tax=Oscillatoria salina TaxID=331517 RepID=UPI001CC93633|nr:RNA methyltransferase [Oscillatoria salina]
MSELTKVRIILVEPAGALNVGSVARVMKNMGLQQLVLVKPHCNVLGQEAIQMAVHATDVLKQALVVESLPEALKGCQRAIATTARSRTLPLTLEQPRNALPWLLTEAGESALIFGPEDRGLSNAELGLAQRFVCIPANPEYPSLNLAQAVAVCVYELYQISQEEFDSPTLAETVDSDTATLDALENYYQHLEAILLKIGYLYPHTATKRMEKLRRLYNRSALSKQELAMLRGILRQIEWALQAKKE